MQEELIHILLVDDHLTNLKLLQASLKDCGCRLLFAQSGAEAIKQAQAEKNIALIIMDVQMPKMDGFETAKIIHQQPETKHTPIIFLSANRIGEGDIFQGYETGAFDYIAKPLVLNILKSKVDVFVRLFKLTLENAELERREQDRLKNSIFDLQKINRNLEDQLAEGQSKRQALVSKASETILNKADLIKFQSDLLTRISLQAQVSAERSILIKELKTENYALKNELRILQNRLN